MGSQAAAVAGTKHGKYSSMKRHHLAALLLVLGALAATRQAGATNLVQNGDFSQTGTSGTGASNQVDYANGVTLNNWTTTSTYTFLVTPALATANGTSGNSQTLQGEYGGLSFYMGSATTLVSPSGGNFLAADGAFQTGTLSQTITGLTVGDHYQLNFYQAGAQQSGFSGPTTDQWEVSLGAQTQYSSLITDASQSFSGWQYVTMNFTATSTTSTLGFFAIGTPQGVPPFAFLDGVSLTDVPEPASLSLMIVGLVGIAALRGRVLSRR
jgi:hypothetical protein